MKLQKKILSVPFTAALLFSGSLAFADSSGYRIVALNSTVHTTKRKEVKGAWKQHEQQVRAERKHREEQMREERERKEALFRERIARRDAKRLEAKVAAQEYDRKHRTLHEARKQMMNGGAH
jgi:hypothetical protein